MTRRLKRACLLLTVLCCASAVCAAGGWLTVLRLDGHIRQLQSEQNRQIAALDHLQARIGGISGAVADAMREQTAVFTAYHCEVGRFDPDSRTALLRFTATPRIYTEGMSVSFLYKTANGELHEAAAKKDPEGYGFTADLSLPALPGEIEVTGAAKSGGTVLTERLDTIHDLSRRFMLTVEQPVFLGSYGYDLQKKEIWFRGDLEASLYSNYYEEGEQPGVVPVLVNGTLSVDGKAVATFPMQPREDTSGSMGAAEADGGFFSADLRPYTAAVDLRAACGDGSVVEFSLEAEDSNGFHYHAVGNRLRVSGNELLDVGADSQAVSVS